MNPGRQTESYGNVTDRATGPSTPTDDYDGAVSGDRAISSSAVIETDSHRDLTGWFRSCRDSPEAKCIMQRQRDMSIKLSVLVVDGVLYVETKSLFSATFE